MLSKRYKSTKTLLIGGWNPLPLSKFEQHIGTKCEIEGTGDMLM